MKKGFIRVDYSVIVCLLHFKVVITLRTFVCARLYQFSSHARSTSLRINEKIFFGCERVGRKVRVSMVISALLATVYFPLSC